MPPEQQVKERKRLQSVYLRDQAYVNSFGGAPAFLEDLFLGIAFQRSELEKIYQVYLCYLICWVWMYLV